MYSSTLAIESCPSDDVQHRNAREEVGSLDGTPE